MSMDELLRFVEQSTIFRGTVVSTLHGLHHGGQDDRDEMAILLEPPEFLVGLRFAKSGRSWGHSSTASKPDHCPAAVLSPRDPAGLVRIGRNVISASQRQLMVASASRSPLDRSIPER